LQPASTSEDNSLSKSDSANFSKGDEEDDSSEDQEYAVGLAAVREAQRQDREDAVRRESGQTGLAWHPPVQNQNPEYGDANESDSQVPYVDLSDLGGGLDASLSYGGVELQGRQTGVQDEISTILQPGETAQQKLKERLVFEEVLEEHMDWVGGASHPLKYLGNGAESDNANPYVKNVEYRRSSQDNNKPRTRGRATQHIAFEHGYGMVGTRHIELNASEDSLVNNWQKSSIRRTQNKKLPEENFLRTPPKSPPKQARLRVQWSMGISAGGLIRQQIFADTNASRSWDLASSTLVNIQILNSVAYESLTSMLAPPSPIDANTYLRQGIPFYELFNERLSAVAGAEPFTAIRSVGDLDAADNMRMGSSLTADMKVGCSCCKKNLCDAM
jgi:hypothetical protein